MWHCVVPGILTTNDLTDTRLKVLSNTDVCHMFMFEINKNKQKKASYLFKMWHIRYEMLICSLFETGSGFCIKDILLPFFIKDFKL